MVAFINLNVSLHIMGMKNIQTKISVNGITSRVTLLMMKIQLHHTF